MKLIFIYGSPGVGKLTVANELSKLTGFTVFHNHMAIDLVRPLYGYGNERSEELVHAVDLSAIVAMAALGKDLIFTYSRPNDREFIRRAVDGVEQHGGKALFVGLACSKEELVRRLGSRKGSAYSKITDGKSLAQFESRHGPFRRITLRKGIDIDTTSMSPKAAALRISVGLGLKRAGSVYT